MKDKTMDNAQNCDSLYAICMYMADIRSLARLNLSSVVGYGEMDNSVIPSAKHFTTKAFLPALLVSVAHIWMTLIGLISSLLRRRPSAADDPSHVPSPVRKRRSATLRWPT
jgi:hypothetical protein